ncbi:hypothetical protein E1B28_000217 [Marasmius oreades]|uniref:Uncharacterized protein n=1 Tax=Marasmius oreades TaxID=181124 RepID=A0A9P7V124_9AGAR|nr:uncharacterized protein E1B28_000217 [Marasmius oreades]KAG7098255.1 hypothetical protein E1B28_000217 [Marasmius oreades]
MEDEILVSDPIEALGPVIRNWVSPSSRPWWTSTGLETMMECALYATTSGNMYCRSAEEITGSGESTPLLTFPIKSTPGVREIFSWSPKRDGFFELLGPNPSTISSRRASPLLIWREGDSNISDSDKHRMYVGMLGIMSATAELGKANGGWRSFRILGIFTPNDPGRKIVARSYRFGSDFSIEWSEEDFEKSGAGGLHFWAMLIRYGTYLATHHSEWDAEAFGEAMQQLKDHVDDEGYQELGESNSGSGNEIFRQSEGRQIELRHLLEKTSRALEDEGLQMMGVVRKRTRNRQKV